jgi:hypothetical protein
MRRAHLVRHRRERRQAGIRHLRRARPDLRQLAHARAGGAFDRSRDVLGRDAGTGQDDPTKGVGVALRRDGPRDLEVEEVAVEGAGARARRLLQQVEQAGCHLDEARLAQLVHHPPCSRRKAARRLRAGRRDGVSDDAPGVGGAGDVRGRERAPVVVLVDDRLGVVGEQVLDQPDQLPPRCIPRRARLQPSLNDRERLS